ncbi:MAG TPA: N-acetylmuramoyl-L-alanine amidase [Candidatus Bipolaricaulota bacterium]|nr:N-acetylmuramoyl-L-alanine amidase [Candidatus Bipolaricaulota bacterium]
MKKIFIYFFFSLIFLTLSAQDSFGASVFCDCAAQSGCALTCQGQSTAAKICQCANGNDYSVSSQSECVNQCNITNSEILSYCECPVSGECPTLCSNTPADSKICKCDNGNTISVANSTQCDTQCAAQAAAAASANLPTVNSIFCDCNTQISQTNDQCKTQCPNYNNQKICMCGLGAKPKTMNAEATPAVCQTDCQAAALAVTSAPAETAAEPGQPAPATSPAIKPKLTVPIPDLHFSDVVLATAGGGAASLPWISEYVIAVYKYAMGIGSILAVIMIMIAGILYLTSAGNPQRIGQAKGYIIGSITGLTILFSSYLLLNLINPALTRLGPIGIGVVEAERLAWEESFAIAEAAAITPPNVEQTDPEKLIPTERAGCTDTGKASKPSGFSMANTSLLGKLDCNATRQRQVSSIKYIVLHDGGGAAFNVSFWTKRCQEKGYQSCPASHYTINRSGAIYQTLGEEKVAYHAQAYNSAGIGIDLENDLPSKFIYSRVDDCLTACKDGKYPCKKATANNKQYAISKCTPEKSVSQYVSLALLIQDIRTRAPGAKVVAHCEGGVHSDPRNFNWRLIGIDPAAHPDTAHCKFYPTYSDRVKSLADKIFGP